MVLVVSNYGRVASFWLVVGGGAVGRRRPLDLVVRKPYLKSRAWANYSDLNQALPLVTTHFHGREKSDMNFGVEGMMEECCTLGLEAVSAPVRSWRLGEGRGREAVALRQWLGSVASNFLGCGGDWHRREVG